MDRKEAIYTLKNTAWLGTNEDREKTEQAVDMAIEALSAEPTDLISRADAIKAIELRQTEQWIDADIDYNNGLESAVAEIKALPSADRPSGEWIPVSEGLPTKNDEYLVTTLLPFQDYNNASYKESHIMFLTFKNGKFFDEFETTDYHDFVTAWMPLPKPYCPNCGAKMGSDTR